MVSLSTLHWPWSLWRMGKGDKRWPSSLEGRPKGQDDRQGSSQSLLRGAQRPVHWKQGLFLHTEGWCSRRPLLVRHEGEMELHTGERKNKTRLKKMALERAKPIHRN